MTLMALASMAFGVYKQGEMKKAGMDAQVQATQKGIADQSNLIEDSYKKRRTAQGAGTVLGGEVSKQGSILSSSQNQKSLLG